MEENKQGIFLGIIGVATLVIAIIGATFAYFSAQVTGNAPVNATSYKFDVTLAVTLVNPSTEPSKGYGLIPLNESNIGVAITNNCIDKNGYAACRIYELKFTNNSGQAVTLNGTLSPSTNGFASFKYSVTTLGGAKNTLSAGNPIGNSPVTQGFTNLNIPTGQSIMYVMLYINNDPENNQPEDQGKTFNGSLTFIDASGGNQLYAQFGPNYVYTGNNGNNATIGQPISVTTYQSPEAAMAALKTAGDGTTNYPFFLAHVLGANDNVSESYVGFVVTDTMAASNPGMVAGTYYLRGNGASFVDNAKTIYDAFGGVGGCYLDGNSGGNPYKTTPSSNFSCRVSGLYAGAYSRGGVRADDGAGSYCELGNSGISHCVVATSGGGG